MSILHLGHQISDIVGLGDSFISTDAVGFDADLDVNCLKFRGTYNYEAPFSIGFAEPAGDLWFQCRFVAPDTSDVEFRLDTDVLTFRDSAGATVAIARGVDNTPDMRSVAVGDTTVAASGGLIKGNASVHWLNVRVSVGANITMDLYDGATLVSSATAANSGGKGKPTSIVFGNADMHNDSYPAANWYYAHLAVLDGRSTIGRRFARRVPSAAGTHNQWGGSLASLADDDIVTRMTSDAAGQRQSATLAGPTGPAGAPIAGVHVKAVAQAGTTGPGSLAGSLRLGGTDHDASAVALSTERPEQAIFSWSQNPDTGAAWTDADLPGEIGLVSAP